MRVGEKRRKKNAIIGSFIIGFLIILSALLIYKYLSKNADVENDIIISDNTFEVTGYFGDTYQLDEIYSLELKDTLPTITEKLYGFGIGQVRRGDFITEEYGECRLYVLVEEGPYLYIQMEEHLIVLNHLNSKKTNILYNDLFEAIN